MPATDFEIIAKGRYLEGLGVDHERGVVWYSDVIAGGLHGVRADRSAATLDAGRMWIGGVMLNADGRVLSSGEQGIRWSDPESGASGWLVREVDGVPINGVNEMVPDGTGGIYFGTIDLEHILQGKPTRPAAIYHLSADGVASLAAPDVGLVNGMMLSADGRTLFYNVTFDATYAIDVAPDRSLGHPRKLLDKPDCDGMALDAAGTLWITGYKSSDIVRLRPDGTLLEPFPTAAAAVTQLRFGGSDGRDIYITGVPADAGDNLAVGIVPEDENSSLYKARSDVPGLLLAPADFCLG